MSNRLAFTVFAFAAALTACSDSSTEPVAIRTAARAYAQQGSEQRVQAGKPAADSLAVLVVDASGAPMANVEVTWSADVGGAVSELSGKTDAQGVSKVAFTAGTRAVLSDVQASPAGLEPVHFTLQVTAAEPARLEAMSDVVDTLAFDEALTGAAVRAVDQYGNAVADLPFAIALVDATGSATDLGSVSTDEQGVAAVPVPVSAPAGDYQLSFRSGELSLSYQLTILPEPVSEGRVVTLRRSRR